MYSKAERQKAVDLYMKRAATVVSEHPNRHTLRLREKQHVSGTITLECDLDLAPGTVYKAYSSRWEIEIVCAITSRPVSSTIRAHMMTIP